MKYFILILIFCLSILNSNAAEIIPLDKKFVQVIGQIESNNNDLAVGDNGKSISRYQIQKAAFIDAKEFDKTIKFNYESLTNKENALRVMTVYLNRYARQEIKNNDFEGLARCWNSGPNWKAKKKKTNNYWAKFVKQYNSARK